MKVLIGSGFSGWGLGVCETLVFLFGSSFGSEGPDQLMSAKPMGLDMEYLLAW